MPGARMNSPLASRSRSARALTFSVMSVAPLAREVDGAGPAAAVLLRRGPGDHTVLVARIHRAGRENTGLPSRRMNARNDDLAAADFDAERLAADGARTRARTHPGPSAAG